MKASVQIFAITLACATTLPFTAVANPLHFDLNDRGSAPSSRETRGGLKKLPLNGRMGDPALASRVVDVSKIKHINIACGETISFTDGKESFSWKFDVIGHGVVNINSIAPKSFAPTDFRIYVDPNEFESTS